MKTDCEGHGYLSTGKTPVITRRIMHDIHGACGSSTRTSRQTASAPPPAQLRPRPDHPHFFPGGVKMRPCRNLTRLVANLRYGESQQSSMHKQGCAVHIASGATLGQRPQNSSTATPGCNRSSSAIHEHATTPVGALVRICRSLPRVARASQPGLDAAIPLGLAEITALSPSSPTR